MEARGTERQDDIPKANWNKAETSARGLLVAVPVDLGVLPDSVPWLWFGCQVSPYLRALHAVAQDRVTQVVSL